MVRLESNFEQIVNYKKMIHVCKYFIDEFKLSETIRLPSLIPLEWLDANAERWWPSCWQRKCHCHAFRKFDRVCRYWGWVHHQQISRGYCSRHLQLAYIHVLRNRTGNILCSFWMICSLSHNTAQFVVVNDWQRIV